ncbi:MAG: alpha/beta hydrolase [Anaerolineae bacterium SM23_ 63]|nr:MAG: alpha/beta hydrolase [Anaerolineae bacterium SM23_ 63]HEY47413.1 alpha/beta hydrolase [Anaerolineae bacterium]
MPQVQHTEPAIAKVKDIEIVFDTFGDPSGSPILLIMGIGCQMIDWRDDFCERLASRGYWVIRYDNRDVGLSTKLDDSGVPNMMQMLIASSGGETLESPYTLKHMADDAVGLLDALKIEKAHVVGVSMGGMIAQSMAIHHPARLASLISIMSSTGEPDLPPPTPEALAVLTTPAPADREGYIESSIENWRVLSGPKFPPDEKLTREHAGLKFDRGIHPAGIARQMAAILASGGRREALKSVTTPTLVIHGDADPLVPVEGGVDTADAISEAKLIIVEGMGHYLPIELWPQLIDAIVYHTSTIEIL